MNLDATLERVRAANPAAAAAAVVAVDGDALFGAIVALPGDPRFGPRRHASLGRTRLVLIAVVLFLVLAGTATAMYFVLRSSPQGLIFPRTREFSFAVLDAKGRPRDIWRCPDNWSCRWIDGVALSPDGRRLALSFDSITGAAPNIGGMHIIDLQTGADRQVPALRPHGATSAESSRSLFLRQRRTFGCVSPSYLVWSPDGSRLAYTCEDLYGAQQHSAVPRLRARIYTIRPNGTGRRLVPTHTPNAYAPSWSPVGKRIAFSTCVYPAVNRTPRFGGRSCRSSLYVVDLDGRHERLLTAGASPDWSLNGKTIAYAAPGCGRAAPSSWRIRLVTPGGRDATPSGVGCGGIGPPGSVVPAWSPDGRRIAIATLKALYAMNADGGGLKRTLRGNFVARGFGGLLRPFWQPLTKESK